MKELYLDCFEFDSNKKSVKLTRNIDVDELYLCDIADYCFNSLSFNIDKFIIGEKVSNLANIIFSNNICTRILIEDANEYFSLLDNDIYSKDFTKLIHCHIDSKKSTYRLLDTVKIISPYCFVQEDIFVEFSKLKKIICNANLEKIEENAFYGDFSGITLQLNNNIQQIKETAFNCEGLKIKVHENPNFISKNDILIFKSNNTVIEVPHEKIISNLEFLLTHKCKNFHKEICFSINSILRDNFLGNKNKEVKILNQYLKEHSGIIADADTIFAYYGENPVLSIPEGISYVSENFSAPQIKTLIIPKSLIEFNSKVYYNKRSVARKLPKVLQTIEKIIIHPENKNFYTNSFCTYDLKNKRIIKLYVDQNSTLSINDDKIAEIVDPFIPMNSKINELIFGNNCKLKLDGRIAYKGASINTIIFLTNQIDFSSSIFNYIDNLDRILIHDLDFAFIVHAKVSRQYKDKIYCCHPSLAKNSSIDYNGVCYFNLSNTKPIKSPKKSIPPKKQLSENDVAKIRYKQEILAENNILELLNQNEASQKELYNKLDFSVCTQSNYYFAIQSLQRQGIIKTYFKSLESPNIIKLAYSIETWHEKISIFKQKIISLLKKQNVISRARLEKHFKTDESGLVLRAIHELIVENEIEQFIYQDLAKRIYEISFKINSIPNTLT